MPPVERPDWGEGGENRDLVPSGEANPDWGDEPDDPDAALVDAGVFTQEELTALQTGKPKPGNSEGSLDPAMVAEWEHAGGVEHHLGVAQTTARTVLDSIPDPEGFQSSFDALPQGVQTAIYSYLAVPPGGSARAASEADLQRFASTPEGAELVKEWGGRAGRKLGVLGQRVDLMLDAMSPADEDRAIDWFDALPPAQKKAVLKGLAG